jgi:curved DNA-binding protein CbpA
MAASVIRMTLYEALGIERDASSEEIEAAFKAKAKTTHPDVGGSVESFQLVNTAREILTDPDKRAQYDATGGVDVAASNERRDALNIVHGMMVQVTGQLGDGPIYVDLIEKMTTAGNQAIAKIEADIEDMRRAIVRLSDLAARFDAQGRDNVLSPMVQEKIGIIEKNIPNAERALHLHKVALEILKDHSFRFDAPAVQVSQWAMSAGFQGPAQFGFSQFP